MSKKKTKDDVAIPATQEAAEKLLFQIGDAQRRLIELEVRMNDLLALAKAEFEKEAQPLNKALEADFQGLRAWAEAHRSELLAAGGKTAKLATGELSWRLSPPSVRLSKPDRVIEQLKKCELSAFVRTKEEVDKEAILANPAAVKTAGIRGVTISQKEEFVAKPFGSEIEKAEASAVSEARDAA